MKKTIKIALLLCLSLIVSALMFTACNITDFLPMPEELTHAPHVHTVVIDHAVTPTCTENGLTEGKHCSVCNEVIKAQEVVKPFGHTEVIDKTVAPTCTKTGLTEGTHCSVCNEVIKAQEYVKPFGHTEVVDKAVAPTCTKTGLTEGKHCSVCNEIIKAQDFVKPFGHTEVIDKAVAPTCTATGLTEGKHCSVCNEVLVKQETVKALGHTEVIDKAVAPTCADAGLTEGKHCSICNEILVKQETIKALGHSYNQTVTPPTATENGIIEYTCSVCGDLNSTEDLIPVDFTVDSSNRGMIGYTGAYGESLVIPAVFQNNGKWYRVTSIGDSAFSYCSGLTSITIPDSVTTLGSYALAYCLELSKVTLGTSLRDIGNNAFTYCSKLTSISIPHSVTSIGDSAFSYCSGLTSITIPNSVTSISGSVFNHCTRLKNITIPDSVTSIGSGAFYNCSSLTSITIPDSVTSIGSGAFTYCRALTSITIPGNVTSIGDLMFYGCSKLTSITIPDTVTSIGERTFEHCTSLTSIAIPDSVTSIGSGAFRYCEGLTSITFKGTKAQWQAINKGADWDRGANNYVVHCTDDSPTITWQEVDKTVYSITEVRLRQEAAGTSTSLAIITKETALHCIKQSTSWYYVEYGELKGYVSKASVTEINILGTDFVEITGGSKVMYANAKTINVRIYPSDADFSTAVGSFKLNDEVTVVATNGAWHRVQYVKNGEQKIYYVSAACLSDAKIIDPNDDAPYKDHFTPVNGETGVEKCVNVGQGGKVNFRKAPNTESTIITSLSNGVKVTVLKTGTVNGIEWSYISVLVTSDNPGVPSEYKFGYIISDYLSNITDDMSLDDLLAHYPTFTKVEGGMMYYVLKEATITIRREPVFPADGEASNSLSNPQSGKTPDSIKAIKVVATGTVNETRWFIVEFVKKDGDTETLIRGFVGGKALEYLTTDANGNPTVTIEDLIAKYPQFTKLETPVNVTANSDANTYGTPDTSGEVLGKITSGTVVKLVAEQSGAYATWYVVEDAEGKLLFVGKEFFK